MPARRADSEGSEIDELALERRPGNGESPVFRVTLRRDGSAEYEGEYFVKHIGVHRGRITRDAFGRLAECAVSSGIWRRRAGYERRMTDCAWTIVRVRAGERRHVVANYARAAPAAHEALECAIEAVASQIRWTRVARDTVDDRPDDVRGGSRPSPG